MIKFLLNRPVAVLMAFTACFIIGWATYFTLPVSLLPDIAIPEITVQVTGRNTSARELENTVVKPLRQQLVQVSHLREIHTETRDGAALIRLQFDFGTHTGLTFIEVNEKIDAAMNSLPRDAERPRVVKANVTDIPVFYLNLTLRPQPSGDGLRERKVESDARFPELCEFAGSVIQRHIEQLPEVAMVDITGMVNRQLRIEPDMRQLELAGFSLGDLEEALAASNMDVGSMTVRDGYYEYGIRFSALLRTPADVENIYLRKADGERLFRLGELAKVSVAPVRETGFSLAGNERAVMLAVIKQSDENMSSLKKALQGVMDYFTAVYPDVVFSVSRNQTELLDYTVSSLKQNLALGFLFICLVAILFLGDVRSPAVIGLSMTASLVISLLFFYLFHVSLNIISLSGLILALGMMIDSSIIVTENIAQYRAAGLTLDEACDRGTTEVITPMLSSTLTTIAVFVPLVFMSGIAGAIFFDQAFAVTVGLLVSWFTGIMLLPVLYKLVYGLPTRKRRRFRFRNPVKAHTLDRFYDRGIDFVFRHRRLCLSAVALTLPLCIWLFYGIPKSRMPDISRNELSAFIEWNENIHVHENRARIDSLFRAVAAGAVEYTAGVGQQQFLLNRDRELSVSESELYFRTVQPAGIPVLQRHITAWLREHYPAAVFSFAPPETVFEKIFATGEADIVAELHARNRAEIPLPAHLHVLEDALRSRTGRLSGGIAFDSQLNISVDRQKLLLYRVDWDEVYRTLKTLFRDNEVAVLRSYQQYLPIVLAGDEQSVEEMMRHTLVHTLPDENGRTETVPLQALVRITPGEDLKTLTAGKNGEYIPFRFHDVEDVPQLMADVRQCVRETMLREAGREVWDVDFTGGFFSSRRMLNELVVILFVSIGLMYFILAAQFESFLQPLIVLLEIPVDTAAALCVLWLCGHSLNLMSAIGIVVTCGIIINDSILKIDAINELRREGIPLMEAIHEAGRRRLRPIIMTSLTTVFAMVPLLFSSDMGSELQKPLSVAMIAAMTVGTPVSLFIIPPVYWLMYRKKERNSTERDIPVSG
ncbi:MAG: efflux RND transporter permease subunit [Tannerella sp.]|jgi:multidrug efflux pump subunit AcrB|nr:efflux RND transporter permease subunit [Tannerella sp.]